MCVADHVDYTDTSASARERDYITSLRRLHYLVLTLTLAQMASAG
jgi:hypothetical protein